MFYDNQVSHGASLCIKFRDRPQNSLEREELYRNHKSECIRASLNSNNNNLKNLKKREAKNVCLEIKTLCVANKYIKNIIQLGFSLKISLNFKV